MSLYLSHIKKMKGNARKKELRAKYERHQGIAFAVRQGRKHNYPSRVRVGRSSAVEWHQGSKTPKK